MRHRSWALVALLGTPLLLPVTDATACLRFKKPGGAIPPKLRDPKDPPPPPAPTAPPAQPTTPTDPAKPPPPVTTPGERPPNPTTPGGGGVTPTTPGEKGKKANDDSTWETWWDLNRIEFFPHRYVHQIVTSEGPTPKGAKPLGADVVRAKMWKQLMTLKDDRQEFVREAALITLGRAASDETLKKEAREVLLQAIKDPNHLVARAAALGLFYVGDEASMLPMVKVAKDPKGESDVRAFTALTLTAMRSPMAESFLTSLLSADKEADFELEASAIMALGFIPGPESARTLKDIFENRRYRVELRAEAVESFGRRGVFEDGADLLMKALEDREIYIRRSAAMALGVLDYRTAAEREAAALAEPFDLSNGGTLPADVKEKVDALKAQVPAQREARIDKVRAIVKRLVKAMEDDTDGFVCSMSAVSLGRLAAQTDAPLATRMIALDLKKERNTVREYEILALAIARASDAYEIALEAVTGRNRMPTTQAAGMIAMGIIGDPKGNEPLRKILEETEHPILRGYAALALGMLGDDRSQGPILTLLKTTKSPEAMSYGALGLALLGKKTGADVLVKRLTDVADGNVAAYTVYALGLMKDRSKIDELVDIAVNHSNFYVQSAAVSALGYVSSAEDYPRRHLMARGFNYMMDLSLLEFYFYKL